MKKQLIRAAATTVLGLSLTTGMAAAQTGSINQTGASSSNHINHNVNTSQTARNHTNASATNNNDQEAYSGSVTSNENTSGGDAYSGYVSNDNTTRTMAHVTMSASAPVHTSSDNGGSASISNTGFNSNNTVNSNTTNTSSVTNDTNLNVSNNSSQESSSGNVNSSRNTTRGNAASGDVSNSSSTYTEFSISN